MATYEEIKRQLEVVHRGNRNLGDQTKDFFDQLEDGGHSIHELNKQIRKLEIEEEQLQAALEETECTIEQEKDKVCISQLEIGEIR